MHHGNFLSLLVLSTEEWQLDDPLLLTLALRNMFNLFLKEYKLGAQTMSIGRWFHNMLWR